MPQPPAHQLLPTRAPNPGAMAFGRTLMILGGVLFAFGGYAAARGAMTWGWPRAEAAVTSAELLRQVPASSRSGWPAEEGWNSFHVLYRYAVDGRDYVAGGVEPWDFGMQNSAGAERMRARHPVGSTARVAYDPRDPAVAYLEPGPSSFALLLCGIGGFMALVGFWVRRKGAAGLGEMNAQEGESEEGGQGRRAGQGAGMAWRGRPGTAAQPCLGREAPASFADDLTLSRRAVEHDP